MTACEHFWCEVDRLYGGEPTGIAVRRCCIHCGIEQVGHVTRWRKPRRGEFVVSAKEAQLREYEL